MHSNWIKLNLWLLRHARFDRLDNNHENDGWYQSIKRVRKIILRTLISFQYVLKALLGTKNRKE